MKGGKTALAVVSAVLMISLFMFLDSREPPEPDRRYHVVNVKGGVPLYLAFLDVGKGMRVDTQIQWVVSESQAWAYANKERAQMDADRYGGVPLPIKDEK